MGHDSFSSKFPHEMQDPASGRNSLEAQCQLNSPGLSCLFLITRQCPPLTLDRKDYAWKILKSPWHTAEVGSDSVPSYFVLSQF